MACTGALLGLWCRGILLDVLSEGLTTDLVAFSSYADD